MTELQIRVIDARRKRAKRLRDNYRPARDLGYTSEEASILMNRGRARIIEDAELR